VHYAGAEVACTTEAVLDEQTGQDDRWIGHGTGQISGTKVLMLCTTMTSGAAPTPRRRRKLAGRRRAGSATISVWPATSDAASCLPVGAVGTYLVSVSARSGVRRGAFGALGVATADAVYAAVAVLGGAALASVIRPFTRPLQLISVVVLLGIAVGLAVQTLRELMSARRDVAGAAGDSPAHRRSERRAGPRGSGATAARQVVREAGADLRTYVGFLGMTVLNPMTVVYFTAAVLAGQGELFRSTADRVVFVAAAAVASASWQLVLASGGAVLGRVATGARGRLVTGLTSSALICVLALRLL
jgi:arginine exporter protein ArgO